MSLLLRQTSKTLVVKIIATMVGMISMLFIYPLDHEAYGTAQFIMAAVLLLLPFCSLGIQQVVIKFFASYSMTSEGRSLLPTMLIIAVLVVATLAGLLYMGRSLPLSWLANNDFDVAFLSRHLTWVLACLGAVLIFYTINGFLTNYGRVAIPTAIQDLGFKLFLPSIVLLCYLGYIGLDHIAPLLVAYYVVSIVIVLLYGMSQGLITWRPDFNYLHLPTNRRTMLVYGAFVALSSLGAMLAFRLDSFMITTLVDAGSNGLYFNILVMASVIDMPNQSISKVAGPMIAKSWTSGDKADIAKMYTKSSLLNQIVGSLIFVGVLVNLEHLFQISSRPEAFAGGISLFVLLGMAKLIDGTAGVNNQVLAYSDSYKYNLYFMIFLAVVSVVTNYLLIPAYGIIGAAVATCISLTLFNVMKLAFLYVRYRLHPLGMANVWILLITGVVAVVGTSIPALGSDLGSIVVKSMIVTGLFLPLIYVAKVSTDFNDIINKQVISRWKRRSL